MTAVRRMIEADASLKSGADLNELFRLSAVVVMPSRIQPAPTFNPPPARTRRPLWARTLVHKRRTTGTDETNQKEV